MGALRLLNAVLRECWESLVRYMYAEDASAALDRLLDAGEPPLQARGSEAGAGASSWKSEREVALEAELARLTEAYDELRDREDAQCPVCLSAPKRVVFNCGHQTCPSCAVRLRECCICRETISIRIHAF